MRQSDMYAYEKICMSQLKDYMREHGKESLLAAFKKLDLKDQIEISKITIELYKQVKGLGMLGAFELLNKIGIKFAKYN